jgi:hypothetical protein
MQKSHANYHLFKNRQVGEKWVSDDSSYLYKGLLVKNGVLMIIYIYAKVSV